MENPFYKMGGSDFDIKLIRPYLWIPRCDYPLALFVIGIYEITAANKL